MCKHRRIAVAGLLIFSLLFLGIAPTAQALSVDRPTQHKEEARHGTSVSDRILSYFLELLSVLRGGPRGATQEGGNLDQEFTPVPLPDPTPQSTSESGGGDGGDGNGNWDPNG